MPEAQKTYPFVHVASIVAVEEVWTRPEDGSAIIVGGDAENESRSNKQQEAGVAQLESIRHPAFRARRSKHSYQGNGQVSRCQI